MSSDFNQVEPVLDIHNIQGNILVGFNKDHRTLLGFLIGDSNKAKEWIKLISDRISTLDEVYQFKKLFKSLRSRQKHEPIGITATLINIAFSYNGMKNLIQDIDKIDEELEEIKEEVEKSYLKAAWGAFKDGLAKGSASLGDPTDESSIGHPKNWCIGTEERGEHSVPDILLIVDSDSPTDLAKEVDHLIEIAAMKNLTVIYNETGHDLSYYSEDRRGKEHFGFKDGISQPAVRGRLSESPKDFLTPRLKSTTSEDNPYDIEYTARGDPLVAPGEFVLGYPQQNDRLPRMVNPSRFVPELLRNGSYLVFRRLRQDVDGFEDFINKETKRLQSFQAFADINSEKLKSLIVGRWPSGAPLARSPNKDDIDLAKDSNQNNNFRYGDDENGYKTPVFSHIRKVNPRDLETDIGDPAKNLKIKLLRRGIPFGKPRDFAGSNDNILNCKNDRGLLFLSYQSSIVEQFERLTKLWMNLTNKPTNPGLSPAEKREGAGHDLIVGQTKDRIRYGNLLRKVDNQRVKEKITTGNNGIFDWVIPTGGGYFFTPSIRTLNYIAEN
jgi:Dyp-type peroxidase family